MKQTLLLLSIFSLVIMAACQPAEPTGGKGSTGEGAATAEAPGAAAPAEVPAAEPVAGQIGRDLNTSDLDEIEKDIDSLVLE